MTARTSFNLRLRRYDPLGNQAGIIPDLGITLTSGPEGGTLTASLSSVISGSLPDDCEVAVEVWADSIGKWQEGRDSRFVLLTQEADDRDRTGVVQVQGVALMSWLGARAALAGVAPYLETGCTVEAAKSSTVVSVSGSTFNWGSAHGMGTGDRVRITAKGKAKGLTAGVYFVRNATSTTFQLSHTDGGAIKTGMGSHGSLHMERIRTRINVPTGHHFKANEKVTVQNADGSNLTDGSLYYVRNPTTNTVQLASKAGGQPHELKANVLNVYRYLDGQRVWKNATPGDVMSAAFLEARDRGWGVDGDGADQVFHSWTVGADSDGYAWKARVDDPTVTGVSVGFQPGTPLTTMLQFLVDNDWAEWSSLGRTLDLRNVASGKDWTVSGNVRRIGTEASEVKVTKDLSEYRTAAIVRGEGPVEERVSISRSPWGVLEQYQQAAGLGSKAHARSYGNADLAKHGKPAVGYVITEAAQEAAYLPILDYQRGDWVEAHVKGVWTRLRVEQWSFTKSLDGSATVTVTLDKVKRSALHKVAKAHGKATAGKTTITHTATPEKGKRKAAKPTALTVTSTAVYSKDKRGKASLHVTWSPVTTDGDGDDLGAKHYEIWVRGEGEEHGHAVATTTGVSSDLHSLPSGHLVGVSVRAMSTEDEWGELSDEVEHALSLTDLPPNPPSTPTAVSTLGSVLVGWDGNLVDEDGPGAPTSDDGLAYVYVERATVAAGPWTRVSSHLTSAGTTTDLGLTVGSTYLYRLVAVDTLGQVSTPSATASVLLVGIDVAQINAAFKASMDSVASIASDAQTVANAAQGAATGAQATADGKNTVYYAATAPTAPTGGFKTGDLWFDTANDNRPSRWTGSAWAVAAFGALAVTSLDAGSITTGTLDATRIAAGTIAVTQLAVVDYTNLFENPTFNDAPGGWGQPVRGLVANGNMRVESGGLALKAFTTGNNDQYAPKTMNVRAGEAFYMAADMHFLNGAGSGNLQVGVTYFNASGGRIGWRSIANLVTKTATATTVDGSWVIPAGTTSVQLWVSFSQNGEATNVGYIDNFVWRRMADANLIVDGAITANSLAATAIDGKTITGATIRTASTAATSGGVILNSSGITGYNASGAATFTVNNTGVLTATGANITGAITATSGTFSGTVNASSGTISGPLTVNTGARIRATGSGTAYSQMDQYGFTAVTSGSDFFFLDFSGIAHGTAGLGGGAQTVNFMVGNQVPNTINGANQYGVWTSGTELWLVGQGTDFVLSNDGKARVYSSAIMNRTYSLANTAGQSSTENGLVVITSSGTLGTLTGGRIRMLDAYSRVISTRALMVASNGDVGTTASTKRVKNLDRHIVMDDAALDAWTALPTWQYAYKADPEQRQTLGVVAEEVAEAGFTDLVYYDERPEEDGGTPGQIDGFAYERMGVYNHLALKRLYARLMAAELRLAALDGKAA